MPTSRLTSFAPWQAVIAFVSLLIFGSTAVSGSQLDSTSTHGYSNPAYPGAVKEVETSVTDPVGAAGSDPGNATTTVLRRTRSLYDAQENLLAEIAARTLPDGAGQDVVTRHRYDKENRLRATFSPDGQVAETRYNAIGQSAATLQWSSVADFDSGDTARARVTAMDYDARGNLTKTTNPDATTEETGYDEENRRTWTQDRLGRRTFFIYDKVGRLRFTLFPDANDGTGAGAPAAVTDPRLADNPRSESVYDLIGRVTRQIDESGAITDFTYEDGCGCAMRRKESIQRRLAPAADLVTRYQYDLTGNVRFVTDPRGNTTETRYDDSGRPRFVVHPATDEHPATQTETQYDALGRRVAVIDAEGKTTRYRYDALGRLIEVRQYLDTATAASDTNYQLSTTNSSVLSTRYAYDALGNQVTQTDALGRTTTYWTDVAGRRTKRILPKDAAEPTALAETYQYDAWGQLWKRTDFAGKTTAFAYDVVGRLKTKAADATHPSLVYSHAIARAEYDYDAAGQRTATRTFNASDVQLHAESTPRDARGRLDYKDTALARLDYTYNAAGQLADVVSSTNGGLNVGYRYDELNRLAYVDDGTGLPPPATARTTAYSYNANGSLANVVTPNGVTHAYSYDALNRLRTLGVSRGATTLRAYVYALTKTGHRRQMVEATGRTADFQYDGLYRLTRETIAGDPSAINGTVDYTLDKVGNRAARTTTGSDLQLKLPTSTATFNARDWQSGDTYDSNGNTKNSDLLATRYPLLATTSVPDVYDFENRLIVRTKPDGSTINLAYDGDGNRIQKTILSAAASIVSSTAYLVDTNNLTGYAQVFEEHTSQISNPTSSVKVYTYGHDLLSRSVSLNAQPSTLNYYLYDGLASVRGLTDATGALTDSYTYDAFGNIVSQAGPATSASSANFNSYLYRGEQFDADLGLYYNRARYLNADSGRFWSADSYEGTRADPISLHKYLYAHANPVSGFDPSGHMSLGEIGAVMNNMMTLARMAQPVIRAYHYASSMIDMINMAVGLSRLLQSGSLEQVFREAMDEVGDIVGKRGVSFSANEAAESFVRNAQYSMHYALMYWVPAMLADVSTGSRMTSYLLFLPNFRGANKTSRAIPLGVKIAGKPVQMVLGGIGSGRLAGIGIQTQSGGNTFNRLFYRMDIHKPNDGHGNPMKTGMKTNPKNEHEAWEESPFHFHVMRYDRSY